MTAAGWHGDDSVTWGIAVLATATRPPDLSALARRLSDLGEHAPALAGATLSESIDLPHLASSPFTDSPLRVGVEGDRILLAAHHHAVDGLGLVALLAGLAGTPVVSRARGLGDRPGKPFLTAALSRLAEALLAPPAHVAPSGTREGLDVFTETELPRAARTADLVAASARALQEWNAERGARTRRIAVAVGASRRAGEDATLSDQSAYLRLRHAERLDPAAVDEALRALAPEPGGDGVPSSALAARVAALLSRRLGSTLLVSHLGELETSDFRSVAFYPVTGGQSGVSLGAATIGGRTTVTLRGRGGEHATADLEQLLALVGRQLEGFRR